MNIKLGDMVIRKGEENALLFKVTGFDGEYVFLKGVEIPIITVYQAKKLIKLNRRRDQVSILRRIK